MFVQSGARRGRRRIRASGPRILHRSATEVIEPVKPLVEQQPHAEPGHGTRRPLRYHGILHGDRPSRSIVYVAECSTLKPFLPVAFTPTYAHRVGPASVGAS